MNFFLLNATILIIAIHLCNSSSIGSHYAKRDKRTIDFVIRGFADVFGYDVLKRPSVVITPTTSPGAPKAAPPTFFPPPVNPLPPPKIPLTPPRAAGAPTKPPAAQPRVTAPPLLTETIRKSFNFNINWNKNVPQTTVPTVKAPPPTAPSAPPQPPVPTAPPQSPTPTAPTTPPKAPVGKNNAVPLTEQNIQYLYDDIEPHRFKILNDNDYEQLEEPTNFPVAQILNPTTNDPFNNYQQSKDKFRESITEFWNHSPHYRDQKGYKFLTTPETNDVVMNFAPERSNYEEYDLVNVDHGDDKEELIKDDDLEDENGQYNDIEQEEDVKEVDKYKTAESKENVKYPPLDHQKKNRTKTVIVSKSGCNHKHKKPQPKKDHLMNDDIKNAASKNVAKELSGPGEVISPRYSGILPVAIDHLTIGEKNHVPWPIPFDTDVSETNKKWRHEIDPRRRRIDSGIAKRSDEYTLNPDRYVGGRFKYKPDVYDPRFDYVAPEQSTENYDRYERVEDAEDDEDLKRARVLMRSFGTRINAVESNKEVTSLNL